jgi:hypothetical protein
MNHKQILTFIFIGFILSACSTKTVDLNQDVKAQFINKSITVTHREKPTSPEIMTPTKAIGMSGLVGFLDSLVLSSFDDGKGYKTIKVPSDYINFKLIEKFKNNYKMGYIENNIKVDKDSLEDIIASYPNSDYILDTTTTYWTMLYFPMHWGTYRIAMFNTMKLIDVKNQKLIAQKQCTYDPKYQDGMPSYDEMFAEKGKLLIQESKKAMDSCIDEFTKVLFSDL